MRLADLPHGCARYPLAGGSLYLPPVAKRRKPRAGARKLLALALVVPALLVWRSAVGLLAIAARLKAPATATLGLTGLFLLGLVDALAVSARVLSGPLRALGRIGGAAASAIARPLACVVAALAFTTAAIGDQSLLATLGERPSWAATLRAPDPGIALSPNIELSGGAASVADVPVPRRRVDKSDRRGTELAMTDAGNRGVIAPLPSLLAMTDASQLPRVSFIRPRLPMPTPHDRGTAPRQADPRASALAQATLASMLTAYAPERVDLDAPFELLLTPQDRAAEPALPPGMSGFGRDHWWSDRPLPRDITSEKQVTCLAQAIYFEARGESERGQEAVAQVVINRVKNPVYPDDVCAVVYQNRTWFNRCQFTFACDRVKDVVRNPEAWDMAMDIARRYAAGETWLPEIGAATHYHTTSVSPTWSKTMRALKTIDRHVFYMTTGGGWS